MRFVAVLVDDVVVTGRQTEWNFGFNEIEKIYLDCS